MRVVIAGGGTAGHVNPALALADSLKGDEVSFMGTSRGAEARLVPAKGYPLHEIEVKGFDRSRPFSIFATAAKATGAVAAAHSHLRRLRPHVVVGMGGYVSLPACLGAKALRMPVVLHEQNIVLGLANRVAKPFAQRIGVSFEQTLEEAGSRGVWTGNPVVPELARLDLEAARASGLRRWELDPHRFTLLVFGGSQGAQRINEAAAGLAAKWASRSDLQVLHITGSAAYEGVSEVVRRSAGGSLLYRVLDYVSHMGDAYGVADLALCRGGASTVAELGAVGLPSIIVPYPHHRDRQQERHARVLATAGAASVLEDAAATTAAVAVLVEEAAADEQRLGAMRAAARRLGRPDAAERLAQLVRDAR